MSGPRRSRYLSTGKEYRAAAIKVCCHRNHGEPDKGMYAEAAEDSPEAAEEE